MKPKILVFAGSTRNHSINKQLAQIAAAKANELGGEGVFIDLADYEMPPYHGDVERDDGIPDAARRFAGLVADADGIVIASPEYNGAYSPLLKNTIDWVTRVDRGLFARPTALISGSPGRMGGKRGLAILRATLENIHVPVIDEQASIPDAGNKIIDGSLRDPDAENQLERVIEGLIRSTQRVPA